MQSAYPLPRPTRGSAATLLALCARLARNNDFPRALTACILNKVPQEDAKVIQETFDHHVRPMGKR
jgi:hypothetical protein